MTRRQHHEVNQHLASPFGNDWFAIKAEQFARFFGTPLFIIIQTVLVLTWIVLNSTGMATFDLYPFILLNLMFSTQAAYAAPMILLAQTRQADRDKAHAEADAKHREDIASANEQRQAVLFAISGEIHELLKQNTALTADVHKLTIELREHINTSK